MSQGGYVTLVGFVAREPSLRQTKDGKNVTDVRVGTTARVLDKVTGEWRDGDTSYYTVNCWRRLADHVKASLRKGDPVMIKGRFKTRSYEDKAGRLRTEVEIVADTVGHDLNRGVANYLRPHLPPADTAGDSAGDESPETADMAEGPGAMIDADGSGAMIDEEAIERFGRDLEDAELAARALDDDEAAGTPASPVAPVPQAPF
jgi:single-strand DNA-binding protein